MLNYEWQELGSASLYTNITIKIDGKLISQSTNDNTSTIQLRFRNSGSWWRTQNGTARFTGSFTDSGSCATYPNKIYDGDTIFSIEKTITHNVEGQVSIGVGGVLSANIDGATRTATINVIEVALPTIRRQSTWASSLLSIPNIENGLTLPINKYVSSYYDVVGITNANSTVEIMALNNVYNGQTVTFTSAQLNSLFTIDNNVNQLPIIFYMNLTTFTDSTKTAQIGSTQRLKCEAYIVNGEPTLSATLVEQDANVISLLGSSTSSKIIKNASDLLFTITATPKNSATISKVQVNDEYATLSSGDYVLNLTNITTGTFNIKVTDSRGLTTTTTITKTLLDYIAVNINSNWTIERVTPISSDFKLNATIDCYSSTIDDNTNTPTVQYSIDNENWTTISSSDYTFADNKITITNLTISNLMSYQNYGKFYLKCTDLLSSNQDNRDIAKGIETFSYGENDLQINGDLIVADEDGNNEANILKSYSTSSEKIIGYWIDGKPIYRKVFQFNSPSTLDTSTTMVSLSSLNIDTVVFDYFQITTSNNITTSSNNANAIGFFRLATNEGYAMKVSNSAYLSSPTTLILEYTKKS